MKSVNAGLFCMTMFAIFTADLCYLSHNVGMYSMTNDHKQYMFTTPKTTTSAIFHMHWPTYPGTYSFTDLDQQKQHTACEKVLHQ